MTFEPLRVTAKLRGAVSMPNDPVALDALLGSAVCMRDDIKPALTAAECVPLNIPVQRSACSRFYLASIAHFEVEAHENHWINRRFPVDIAQAIGDDSLTRIRIGAGPAKSYRLPLDTIHLRHDVVTWWCMGEPLEIRDLLSMIGYLGKKRSVGLGHVTQWSVEIIDPWPGFPVLRNGLPLRSLPADYPDVDPSAERAYKTIEPPYWDRTREVLCVVPSRP